MESKLRRRRGGQGLHATHECPTDPQASLRASANRLVRDGAELYEEAELSHFQKQEKLEKSLFMLTEAAEEGEEDAIGWISNFLTSVNSTLPPSVILPNNLVKIMQWVTESNPTERQVRSIAKSMFRKMAGDGKVIPKSEIDERAKTLLSSQSAPSAGTSTSLNELKSSVKHLLHSALLLSGTDEVTEESFCEAAIDYSRGSMIAPQEGITLTPLQLEEFDNANILKKVLKYPRETISYFKRSFLREVQHRGVKWLWASFPTKQFYLLLLAYILPMLSVTFMISMISTVVFGFCFLTMCITTMQIIENSERVFAFFEFSTVFQYFSTAGMHIDIHDSEKSLIKRSIGPYIGFGVALLVAILSLGLAHQQIIYFELLCMVAGVLAFGTFLQYQVYKSPVILVSISARLISWLYAFLLIASSWLPVPEFFSTLTEKIVTIPVFPGVSLSVNVMTLVQLPIQVGVTVYLLVRYSWHNFHSNLGPYAIFVSWWVLCRNFLTRVRSLPFLLEIVIGIAALFTLLPLIPLAMIFSPVFFLFYYGPSAQFLVALCVVIITALVALFLFKYFGNLMETKYLKIPLEYVFLLQILIAIPLILLSSFLLAQWYRPTALPVVTMSQYDEYCGIADWEESGNMVQTQLDCLHLEGRIFEARGTVQTVKISQVVNDKEVSLRSLPVYVQIALTCLFGETDPMCGERDKNMTTCIYAGCHFDHSNRYSYEIKLDTAPHKTSRSVSMSLTASGKFKPFVTKLRSGMQVQFNATFVGGMGTDSLQLELFSVWFDGELYQLYDDNEEEEAKEYMQSRLLLSMKATLQLFLEIVFGYTALGFFKG